MPAYFRFLTILAFHVFLQEEVSVLRVQDRFVPRFVPRSFSPSSVPPRWTWPWSKSGSAEPTTAPTSSGGSSGSWVLGPGFGRVPVPTSPVLYVPRPAGDPGSAASPPWGSTTPRSWGTPSRRSPGRKEASSRWGPSPGTDVHPGTSLSVFVSLSSQEFLPLPSNSRRTPWSCSGTGPGRPG